VPWTATAPRCGYATTTSSASSSWINGIEFVADFADVGGGYNRHHEFFGYRQAI